MKLPVRSAVAVGITAATLLVAQGAVADVASSPAASPTLTVVGFAVINLPPEQPVPPQLDMNLTLSGSTPSVALKVLNDDIAAIRSRLEAMGLKPAAFQTQGPPQINYVTAMTEAKCKKVAKFKPALRCSAPGYTASEELQVTFPNLRSLARALSRTAITQKPGVQTFWINQGEYQTGQPTAAALASGYKAALANAHATAIALAKANRVVLAAEMTVTEGGAGGSQGSSAMGGCGPAPGISVPSIGQDQELVGVTVTYATRPLGHR